MSTTKARAADITRGRAPLPRIVLIDTAKMLYEGWSTHRDTVLGDLTASIGHVVLILADARRVVRPPPSAAAPAERADGSTA